MRPRVERYQLMLAHRAAAAALEASLKDEAAGEYEREHVRVTWEWPGAGQVVASLRHDAVTITDQETLTAWLRVNYPHQVRQVTRWEPINTAWLTDEFLAGLVPTPFADDEPEPAKAAPGDRLTVVDPNGGAVVPGVRWVKGGGLASVAVKPDRDAVRRMNLAAAEYAAGAGPMPGLTSGENDG